VIPGSDCDGMEGHGLATSIPDPYSVTPTSSRGRKMHRATFLPSFRLQCDRLRKNLQMEMANTFVLPLPCTDIVPQAPRILMLPCLRKNLQMEMANTFVLPLPCTDIVPQAPRILMLPCLVTLRRPVRRAVKRQQVSEGYGSLPQPGVASCVTSNCTCDSFQQYRQQCTYVQALAWQKL